MKKITLLSTLLLVVFTSCVSKKKYIALENDLSITKSALVKTQVEKEGLETKVSKIEARVAKYNKKINSLKEVADGQMSSVGNLTVMSNNTKKKMRATLAKVDPAALANAKSIEDSINLAIAYNLKKSIADDNDDVDINVDKTVVMINISDRLLFNSGSHRVSNKANEVLAKIAAVINSEPSMEVMVEGHTDSRTIQTPQYRDNWDLSVKRATSIVRLLQSKHNVDPAKLIASGRSSYLPLVENDSKENRAKNRRTKIIIIPNLDKFFALLDSSEAP
ncbi:MAG: OmpA family protein [Cellulophaga sp.]